MIGVRLEPGLFEALHALAQVRGKSLSMLIREILMEYSRGVLSTRERVLNTLDRISALVKTLEVQLLSVGIAGIDTQRQREKLYEIAVELLKEAVKLSESEEAARNARARMQAMQLASTANRTALAILSGHDQATIIALLEEIKKEHGSIRAELRALSEGAKAAQK